VRLSNMKGLMKSRIEEAAGKLKVYEHLHGSRIMLLLLNARVRCDQF
jgi:hypothetical protein